FNPSTTISFSIPENSFVTLKVYDVLGSEVAELVNGQIEAGIHKVNFNAFNLNTGVYFYTIKAGNFTETKKLMLVK
ncbi:MAG: T9SS type A sorting domain-containing protein, partial [Ignavibacteriaceae bacterium]|nr:T9SS type A sorting domain-containing protein [Ignavibacteriaceae bacterium]